MIVSKCHKERVEVECGNEGVSFYVCEKCHKPCDTMMPLEFDCMEFANADV